LINGRWDLADGYPSTGISSRADERMVFRLLVPTLAWRKLMIAADDEVVAAWRPTCSATSTATSLSYRLTPLILSEPRQ